MIASTSRMSWTVNEASPSACSHHHDPEGSAKKPALSANSRVMLLDWLHRHCGFFALLGEPLHRVRSYAAGRCGQTHLAARLELSSVQVDNRFMWLA